MKSFQFIIAGVAAFLFAFAGMAAAEGVLPGQDLRIKVASADNGLEDDYTFLPPFEIINDPSVTFITVKNDPAEPTLTMTAPSSYSVVVSESAQVDASSTVAAGMSGGTYGTSTYTSYTTVTMTKCSTCVGGGTFGTPTGVPVFVTRKYPARNGTASLVNGTGPAPVGTGVPVAKNVTKPTNGTNGTAPEADSSAAGSKSFAGSIIIGAFLFGAVLGL